MPGWTKAPPRSTSLNLNLSLNQFRSQYSPRQLAATEHIDARDWQVAKIKTHIAALNRASAFGTPVTKRRVNPVHEKGNTFKPSFVQQSQG